jgi:hypothetical protein
MAIAAFQLLHGHRSAPTNLVATSAIRSTLDIEHAHRTRIDPMTPGSTHVEVCDEVTFRSRSSPGTRSDAHTERAIRDEITSSLSNVLCSRSQTGVTGWCPFTRALSIPVASGRADTGHALETAVFNELERRRSKIGYVNTADGFEADSRPLQGCRRRIDPSLCASPNTAHCCARGGGHHILSALYSSCGGVAIARPEEIT